jgi:hypothetical protein
MAPATELMFTMRPERCRIMCRAAACAQWTVPSTFTSMMRSQSVSAMSRTGPRLVRVRRLPLIGDVELHAPRGAAGLLERLRDLRESGGVAVAQRDARSLPAERQRGRAPDARGGPGDGDHPLS